MNAIIADQTLDAEEYAALARALRWVEGFGAFFVECSPAQGRELVTRLTHQLEKRCQLVALDAEIKDLRQYILHLKDYKEIQVLFIIGLEKSFERYIKAGYGGEGDYYKEDTPVPVLGRLNLDREVLRRDLPQLAVVFMLPRYGIKYFIRRAPDFFDWRSGWFHFATEKSLLSSLIAEKTAIDYDVYSQQSVTERQARLLELADLSEEPAQTDEEKAKLYREMGIILHSLKRYEEAISYFDKVIIIKSNDNLTWYNRSITLTNLGRHNEAKVSYKKSLSIQPNNYESWYNRGIILSDLGYKREALECFDRALTMQSAGCEVWNARGDTLRKLRYYEQSIVSYDKSLSIEQNSYVTWCNRGIALYKLGRYQEAISNFDKAISINYNFYKSWHHRGNVFYNLGRYEEAITNYDKALQIEPNDSLSWNNRGNSLRNLGYYEEATINYNKMKENKMDGIYTYTPHKNRVIPLSRSKKFLSGAKLYIK